ncbi:MULTISPECIES: GrpB family protein [unclassified Microbacterium]|uniref:GrpB family protein n=1 Tax=unclassified Microbacterium TaxID=2609290 RepID=UPI0015E33AAA|nr:MULTISPECIES: GrpB family protein [unclassified Microbacterium]
MSIVLVPYDPAWPAVFEEVATELREHGDPGWDIEHIGSTAIPGLSAKPVIDVAVRIVDDADFLRHRPAFETIGWRVGSGIRRHRVMVFEVGDARTRIAHFFEAHTWDDVSQRILRDWLREHPDDVVLYERAKHAALDAARNGEQSYNAGKTKVIQLIMDKARIDRGLAPIPVHDKS